jgi:flagellar biosynthesis protein FlhB
MSDDSEKHFEPTPSRIAKAKREGNVVRAQELSASLAFASAAAATCLIARQIAAVARGAMISAAAGRAPYADVVALGAWALVPTACAAGAAITASCVQSGGFYSSAVSLKLERLNPAEGLKRVFSRETPAHAMRALAAFALAFAALIPVFGDLTAVAVGAAPPATIGAVAWRGAERAVALSGAIGLAFGFIEFGVARRSWLRKLRMSFEELKREIKEHDGDPQARNRRKALHRNLVRGALTRVKDAAFVVVNPTHVALALEYRPPAVPVPLVLVRAADGGAQRVRELAARYGIPVVQNVALARALFADADVGQPIPYAHYVAVAEVVAALMRSGALA